MRRILVIRGGAIGDFILTLPVLGALRARFPGASLRLVGQPRTAPLAVAEGLIDQWRSIESPELVPLFNPHTRCPDRLRPDFAGVDLVVSYMADHDGVVLANLRAWTGAPCLTGPPRPDETLGQHATEAFLEPVRSLGTGLLDPVPRLNPLRWGMGDGLSPAWDAKGSAAAARAGAERLGFDRRTTWLAIHPGSGSPRKNWPESAWANLLRRLGQQPDWHLLLVGGEAETGRLQRLASCWPSGRVEIAERWPLVEVARRMACCDAFAGHDSGITHLAAALGLPGVVLWGESSLRVWRPCCSLLKVMEAGTGLALLPADGVASELEKVLRGAEPRA